MHGVLISTRIQKIKTYCSQTERQDRQWLVASLLQRKKALDLDLLVKQGPCRGAGEEECSF